MSECTHNCSSCSSNCSDRTKPQDLREKPHELSKIKKVIAVVSGKGGVGKSMVTSLLSVSMQRKGYKTAIMDADITGPSIPKAFGIKEKASGSEIIFLTQNFYNTGISPYLKTEAELKLAKQFSALQHAGVLRHAFEKAKALCERENVRVCDLYSVWEKLYENGVNTTELLSNKLNHPTREIHYYMAIKLIETMLEI